MASPASSYDAEPLHPLERNRCPPNYTTRPTPPMTRVQSASPRGPVRPLQRSEPDKSKTKLPTSLDKAVAGLVESAYGDARRHVDHSESVNNLVSASHWNPALLMAAQDEANRLADGSPDEQLETAIASLQAATERVRQRAY